TGFVRQRSDPALGLATSLPERPGFLPGRGGGEDDYPFVGLLAECRNRGGSGDVKDAETLVGATRNSRSAALNELPRRKLRGYQKIEFIQRSSPPNALIGGPLEHPPLDSR